MLRTVMSTPSMGTHTVTPERAAIEWEVRLREGDADAAELAAFDKWFSREINELAWNALQQRLARMRTIGAVEPLAVSAALRATSTKRRKLIQAGFGVATLAFSGLAIRDAAHALGLDADWQSGIGQRSTVNLADGSRMTIDAGSRIYRGASASATVVALKVSAGQALIEPQAGSRGTLRIEADHGVVSSAGATLNVGRIYRHTVVSVTGGDARLSLAGRAPVHIDADSSVAFSAQGVRRLSQPFELMSAWTRGLYVADNAALPELFDVFNRYRGGIIRATGAAAQLRVSGVFALNQIDRALTQVADTLPVDVTRVGSYLTVFS
jgi:transmembrane sensor